MSGNFTITSCPSAHRAEALRVLHAGLPTDQQIGLVHALQAVRGQDDSAFEGLLTARASNELVGATWAQLSAGQTAVVWLPAISSPAAVALLQALSNYLDERGVSLAQFLVGADEEVSPDFLAAADFQKLARLAYLTADNRLFPTKQPSGQLHFQPHADANPERLGELLLRTYQDSRDCPQLNGVRTSSDVLEGYREQGTFAPERWFIVQREGRDVGTLILTNHEYFGNWELVYMGLVPETRGAGLGRQILDFALWQARLGGAQRLVLAVDEANQYAREMYERAGFVAWDYRTVYARLRPQRSRLRPQG